jgi:predicted TIM-barrel fold metal-dependent hydrolase
MADFEIIDAHIHLARTLDEESNYWLFPGRRSCDRYGTPEKAVEYMEREGISRMVYMVLIPRQYRGPLIEKNKLTSLPEKQRREEEKKISEKVAPKMREMNEWGCEVARRFPQLVPFICISPELGGAEGMVKEVELRASQGAKGIKLHPGMFAFFPYDEVMFPAYEKCQELGLPVLADSGAWPTPHVLSEYPSPVLLMEGQTGVQYGEPANWAKAAEAFPRLTIVMAHLGSAWWDERVELAQKYPNIYFDTSQGFSAPDRIPYSPHRGLAEMDVPRIFRKIGMDRILFGTDFPALAPQPQVEQIMRLPLTDEEKQKVLAGNAKRVYRI